MAMTVHDYLAFRCNQMLAMEHAILQLNNQMADEAQHPRLKSLFTQHRTATEQQIRNLEHIVNRLGQPAEPAQDLLTEMAETLGLGEGDRSTPLTRALLLEHRQFLQMTPPQNLIDLHNAIAGDQVENMEIAAYNNLISLATHVNEADIAQMLRQNLQSEESMRSNIERAMPVLFDELTGMTGMGEKAA